MILLADTIVKRPLCPTLIHDEPTRMVVVLVLLALCLYALYRVFRHYDSV